MKDSRPSNLGRAVELVHTVHAFLYLEGGPQLHPTRAQARSWSLESDPIMLGEMRHLIETMTTEQRNG